MKWYLAKIIFQIICGDGEHTAQFDEQLRLIAAENESKAFIKARQMGENEQESFMNQQNQAVQWKFINVAELYPFCEMIDGAEMYSRIYESDNAKDYISTIHKRADNLAAYKENNILQFL